MKKRLCLSLLVSLIAAHALGSGFALFEHSARGMGRGGAMVGEANDPSAVYYNPAGITQLEGFHFDFGVSPIHPIVSVSDRFGNTYDVDDSLTTVPHLHMTYQVNDRLWLGGGVFAPFGLATKFDENWAGRYNNTNAEVAGINFNFNVGYKVTDALSLAVGVSLQYFDVTLEQKILPSAVILGNRDAIVGNIVQSMGLDPYTADLVYNTQFLEPSTHLNDIGQSIEGDKTETGWNVALHYKPNDKVSFGFSYRSAVEYEIDGDATYSDVTPGFIFPFESVFFNADGVAKLELPSFMYFGVAFYPSDRLTLEVDAWETGWSSYDVLDLQLNNGVGHVLSQKNWDDSWALRLGGEYDINETNTLVFGYVYDDSPIPDDHIDYLLPSNDRQVWSLGYMLEFGKWRLDASYGYLAVKDRQIAARPEDFVFDSDVEGTVHLYSVGLSYRM